MKKDIWLAVQKVVNDNASPLWVKAFIKHEYADVELLPELAEPFMCSGFFRPKSERERITSDYIDFLRTQIALKPRGQDWANILSARVKALLPFIGREVEFAHLYYFDGNELNSLTIAFEPKTGQMIFYD